MTKLFLIALVWNISQLLLGGSAANAAIVLPDFAKLATTTTQNQQQQQQQQQQRRIAEQINPETCEVSFITCLQHQKCVQCFSDMQKRDIDWTIVAPHTPCADVVEALSHMDKCRNFQNDTPELDVFCNTFDSCAVWVEEEDDDDVNGGDGIGDDDYGVNGNDDEEEEIDCDALETCDFKNFKPNYLGDGICHEFIGGCYNSKVCGYDNGDCCPDTCKGTSEYADCGSDGYFCRDPASADYDNGGADETDDNTPIAPTSNCTKQQTPFRLFQFSSFGDGWDGKGMEIVNKADTSNPVFKGQLKSGSTGEDHICLSNEPACYNVKNSGGTWGNELSWQIKAMAIGAGEVASGGSPMNCDFPVAGGTCDNTCTGRPNLDPKKDKDFQSYHQMESCVKDKCVIQVATCEGDPACIPCMADVPPAYCLANKQYEALVFCTQCNCVSVEDDTSRKEFCSKKSKEKGDGSGGGGGEKPGDNNDNPTGQVHLCDKDEKKMGQDALSFYSQCADMSDKAALMTDFHEDNFGMIGEFEKCASDYVENQAKNPLQCMKILQNAIDNPIIDENDKDKEDLALAISTLANDLLHNGQEFCDCSAKASKTCPACKDFIRFKTLLYESLDACEALDKIDCAAWETFYGPCKDSIEAEYKKVNFRLNKQCEYVKNGCGNVGPFPSFRKLDCGNEISDVAWQFYLDYDNKCTKNSSPATPNNPQPQARPTSPVPAPTAPRPYNPKPVPAPTAPRPYKPTPDNTPGIPDPKQPTAPSDPWDDSKSNEPKKKYVPPEEKNGGGFWRGLRNFVVFVCICGGGWYIYRRRNQFDYSQFRRVRNFTAGGSGFGIGGGGGGGFGGGYNYNDSGAGDSNMYDSLTMMDQSGATSFQPPSLPPPPSAYMNNNGNNGLA